MRSIHDHLLTRRVAMGGLAAGIGLTLSGSLLAADTAPVITKAIPRTAERLPVIGLGTNAYSVSAPEELAARREVLQKFPVLGAKVVDTPRAYGES